MDTVPGLGVIWVAGLLRVTFGGSLAGNVSSSCRLQLVVKFSPFALFAGFFMLRHFATSVLGYLDAMLDLETATAVPLDAQQRQ